MSDQSNLEALVESAIVAALTPAVTAVAPTLSVVGFWQPAAEGNIKVSKRSVIDVKVPPRESETWDHEQVVLRPLVAVQLTAEDDERGALLTAVSAAVLGVLGTWDADDDAAASALSVAGIFRCDAVMFGQGGDCAFDASEKMWFAIFPINIKGCLVTA